MNKQREALEMALEALDTAQNELCDIDITTPCEIAIQAIREALAEPEQELEFWPGEILVCKEDDSKVTVVNGNRGSLQLMNGKIAIAWSDTVGGEYTIEQIKEMFYRTEKPEQEPVAWMCPHDPERETAFSWRAGMCESSGCGHQRIPLYTAPPARKPLTDEEIDKIIASNVTITDRNLYGAVYMAIREVEAAHGIGGE